MGLQLPHAGRSAAGGVIYTSMPHTLTLDDIDVTGKTVLVRADLNVPMQHGKVSDYNRIKRLLPTIDELSKAGAKVVLLSHFDRPKGKYVPSMSLAPLADALSDKWGKPVHFGSDCIGSDARRAVDALQPGHVTLLENLRFYAGEEGNDTQFAKALAELGDVYVNDAFSCSHRAHASIVGIPAHIPAAAGRLMQDELQALGAALDTPDRPLAAIIGGAKVSSKLKLLDHMVEKVDVLIIGGGMANTFLHAQGKEVGASLCEKDLAETAQSILAKAATTGCQIILPSDVMLAKEFRNSPPCRLAKIGDIETDEMILDVGPVTLERIMDALETCKTLVWNGPLGAFETTPFDVSTSQITRIIASLTVRGRLVSIAGGGDTVSALRHAGLAEAVTYLSTAGGAFLEWLEGKPLPGIDALHKAAKKAA